MLYGLGMYSILQVDILQGLSGDAVLLTLVPGCRMSQCDICFQLTAVRCIALTSEVQSPCMIPLR